MGGFGDGRQVLHLECDRAGRLSKYDTSVGLYQFRDAGADQRIVKCMRHAHAGEKTLGQFAARAVGAVHHQQMVAAVEKSKKGGEDRGLPRAESKAAPAALDAGYGILQREGGRRAMAAVENLAEFAFSGLLESGDIGIQDGRGVIYRDIHDAAMGCRVAPQNG